MKIIAAILFVALMFAGMAHPQDVAPAPESLGPGDVICDPDKGFCIVRTVDLAATSAALRQAVEIMKKQHAELERLTEQNRVLSTSKGCAKLTVEPKPPPVCKRP